MSQTINIYAIYTVEDKSSMLRLFKDVKAFGNDFNLSIWHDNPIEPGQQWKPQIESRFQETDVFLLLISSTFMRSEFIKQLEFKNVIDRYKENKSVVVPIVLEDCQWSIDFEAEDYTFNFNELQVLPDAGKPLSNWDSPDEAYSKIRTEIRKVLNRLTGNTGLENSSELMETTSKTIEEDQLAINFTKEKEAEEEKLKAESEAKRKTDKEIEAKKKAEAKRFQKETEIIRKKEEELRLKKEVEARKRDKEEQRILAKSEAIRRAEEKKRLKNAEVEAQNVAMQQADVDGSGNKLVELDQKNKTKRRVLTGSLITVLALVGIWVFSPFNTGSEKQLTPMQFADTVEVMAPAIAEPEIDLKKEEEVISKLAIGSVYDGGFIFEIDDAGKNGKIARTDDAGPMPWKSAMKIHEQLGEGWRLPTMEELKLMHKTIGQGATNNGEFADELYWSSTPYDENQARLVRFSDGNMSYHYNSGGTHRNFRVRAIRDFGR